MPGDVTESRAEVNEQEIEAWTTSAALIAMGPNTGAVLEYCGSGITLEISEAGLYALDELGLDDAPLGLSIWEGEYVFEPGYIDGYEAPGEGQSLPKGKFRELTPEEWEKVRKREPLW